MSEKLVFELQAIDRATAPLRQVSNELDRTSSATRRLAGQFDSTGVATRKWAMGALQQAGYQVGDFAVQVANGTNRMQAFGQQAPQLLQIFGPLGAVAGAAVAIFASVAVVADKASGGVTGLAQAMKDLTGVSAGLSSQMEMLRFGVDTAEEATVLRSILNLRQQIASKTQDYRSTDSLATRQRLAEEIIAIKTELHGQQSIIDEINKKRDAIKRADVINRGMMAVELAHARIIGNSERDRIARAEQIHAQMIAIQAPQAAYIAAQESFNNRLRQGYALYGNLRMQAQGLAADAAAAAQAAVDPQMFKLRGAYQLYARTRLAAPDQPPVPKDSQKDAQKDDPMKALQEQLALENELIGKTEAQQRVIQALGLDYKKYGEAALSSLVGQITNMDQLNKLAEQQKEIADAVKSSFSSAFMSMIDGTKSAKDAFRDMARSIIAKLYEVLVVQNLVNGIMGFVGKAFPSLAPAIAGARAMGGPVTGGKAYMVGERGPEMIVPSRNAQVVPNNQVGGGSGVTINQNISFGAGVSRAEIQAMIPKIVESTKSAVFDAQRRSVNGMGFA